MLTLVVLLIVSMLGLSLSLSTMLERQLGANRRGIEQALWAADSGLALAAARVLTTNDMRSVTVDLGPAVGTPGTALELLRNRAEVIAVRPLLLAPCGLCQINDAGSYADSAGLLRVHLAIASRGTRFSVTTGTTPVAKRVEATLDLEPWTLPGAETISWLAED